MSRPVLLLTLLLVMANVVEALQLSKSFKFSKYQGLGNDFILIDNTKSNTPILSPEEGSKLCDRNFGVGGDGVIFVLPGSNGCDYTMRIYNSDGSEPQVDRIHNIYIIIISLVFIHIEVIYSSISFIQYITL